MSVPKVIVIVGAGRSGTKILRDVLCNFSGWGTWPCDEINYIWRYGNAKEPTDELTPEHARQEVVQYIRNQFRHIARKKSLDVVVEKTCANTLRIPFVNEVLPHAKFVHLVRDGRDVAVSARKRWTGSVDLEYILRKARYVPLADLPYYTIRFLRDRVYRFWSEENRIAAWGPRFSGMQGILRNHDLIEACALQWKYCVEKAASDLSELDANRTYRIHYESFVQRPVENLKQLRDFFEIGSDEGKLEEITRNVFSSSVGNWKKSLSEVQSRSVHKLLETKLREFGYLG